jgi:L-amino acid N-acyltransferase YncA
LLRRYLHPAFSGVLHLAVSTDPDWRGRGVGKALVAAAIDWEKHEEARRVQLAVVDGNTAALLLFHGAAFVEEGRLIEAAEIAGKRYDVIAMARRL